MSESGQFDSRTGALVLGGGHVGLNIVRSLGRHGIPVWCVVEENSLPLYSRYCTRRLYAPLDNHIRMRDMLMTLAKHEGLAGWTLFPTSDESAKLLARHHALLSEQFVVTVPPLGHLQHSLR
jgi:predicted ATP-grasp superfamily ATP-dependent carboligase